MYKGKLQIQHSYDRAVVRNILSDAHMIRMEMCYQHIVNILKLLSRRTESRTERLKCASPAGVDQICICIRIFQFRNLHFTILGKLLYLLLNSWSHFAHLLSSCFEPGHLAGLYVVNSAENIQFVILDIRMIVKCFLYDIHAVLDI